MLDYDKWFYVRSGIGHMDPSQYFAVNAILEKIGANVRFGPPSNAKDEAVGDPTEVRLIGYFMKAKEDLKRNDVKISFNLRDAIETLAEGMGP